MTEVVQEQYAIRQAERQDLKYICQSWLYAYQESPEMNMPGLINDDYFGYQHKLLDDIIPRASKAGSLYICHEEDKPHLFRGYLCAEPFDGLPVVHWLQIKKHSKRKGVATALMQQFYKDFGYVKGQNCVYTHSAKDLRQGWLSKRVKKEYAGCYVPWMKYTLAAPGWER